MPAMLKVTPQLELVIPPDAFAECTQAFDHISCPQLETCKVDDTLIIVECVSVEDATPTGRLIYKRIDALAHSETREGWLMAKLSSLHEAPWVLGRQIPLSQNPAGQKPSAN